MKKLNELYFVLLLLFLTLGYFASQFSYFNGTYPKYALAVDVSRVKWLSLFAFIGIIAVALFRKPAPSDVFEISNNPQENKAEEIVGGEG